MTSTTSAGRHQDLGRGAAGTALARIAAARITGLPPGATAPWIRAMTESPVTADASAIAHRVEGVIHPDAELVELVWVEIGSKPLADLHPMTRNVLNELEKRLATGPLKHDAAVPFFHFYGGKMQKDVLGESKAG